MRVAAFAQGVFYIVSGVWPIIHVRSFEAVTGKKREPWLVQTTGALIAAVGLGLLVAAFERRSSRAAKAVGIASASALAAADLVFTAKGTIPRIYLADAAAEAAFVATWVALD